MKRITSKLAAFLLVAVMVVSLFPASVFAEDTEGTGNDNSTAIEQIDGENVIDGDEGNTEEIPIEEKIDEEKPADSNTPSDTTEEPAPVLENSITSQPEDAIVAPNKKAVFGVETNGEVFSYKWEYSKDGITWKDFGSKKSSISVKGSTAKKSSNNGYMYRCTVTFQDKTKVTSDAATLFVASKQSFKTTKGSSATNADVSVEAPEGTFPTGTTMAVADVDAEDYVDAINEVLDNVDASKVTAIDISFNYDGEEIEPANDNKVTVTLKSDAVNPGVQLVHIDDFGNATVVAEEDIVSIKDGEVVFTSDSFSVYATVSTGFSSNQQYVIYTGTTALAYNGNNLTTATVTVSDGVVRSESDNIVWTATQSGQNWRLYYRNGTGPGAQDRYLRRNNNTLETRNGGNNDCNVVYHNYNHRLSINNRYLTFNNGTWGVTQNPDQAATVYIALVGVEPPSGELTYYYYNADGSSSVAATETAETLTTSWTNVSTLAKEIEGYTFLEARANSKTGDVISQVNNRAYRVVGETTGNGETLNDIYFIYIRDYVAGEDIIPGLNGPVTEKEVTENDDGTFTIALEITGVTNDVKHGANVVIVLDRTSSMSGVMRSAAPGVPADNTMRINAAIAAVNTLVTTLNPGDPSIDGFYDIDFALVEFDRNAEAYDFGTSGITGHTQWTKSGDAINTRVGRYEDGANLAASGATPGAGGTNWQAALLETAKVLENKPDADPTYVIFMTDGEPTIYIGSSDVRNNRSTTDPEYYASVPYATAIVNADYHMYDIFCSAGTTTLLNSLYTTSGAESYVMAGTQSDLEAAFTQVANDMIDAIGSSDYAANDGVPSMGSFDFDTVDGELQLSSARYYIQTPDAAAYEEWTDAPVAKPSSTGVKWDLSEIGTLAGGTKYKIEFEVWPSQAAYDLIADLNNGLRSYDADGENPITAEQRAQIDEHIDSEGNKTYTLKTNTGLTATYKLYGKTHTDNVSFEEEAMDLPVEPVSVVKIWPENMLDDYGAAVYRDENDEEHTATEINLTLMRGTEEYYTFLVKGSEGWRKDDIYISNGFMTVEEVNGEKVAHVKETGHDYQIIEPAGFSYYWDLVSDVYHPMVINGHDEMLILNTEKTSEDVDWETYFELDGKIYEKKSATDNTLEASNYRRSNLNLTKVIDGAANDSLFEYKATVKDSNSNDGFVWFSAWDPVASDYVYDLDVTGGNVAKETKDIPENATINDDGTCTWTETKIVIVDEEEVEVTETYTRPIAGEGKYYTGYFYATNGAELTMKIKAGWNVRFLNVYHDTTFSFEETGMPGNYEFKEVAGSTKFQIMKDSNKNWYTIDEDSENGLITGKVTEPNNNFTVTYTNRAKQEFYIYHSGVAGDGNLETVVIPEEGETLTGNWNTDGTYNLFAHTTDGTLYGGYYLNYAGKGTYADDGVKGENGVKYTGMNNTWSGAQTVEGTKIEPVAGETYYIKEVPLYYLRNYHQINYVKSSEKLTALYLISAIDDLHYKETGLLLQTNDGKVSKVTSAMTYRNTATNRSVTLTANSVFKNVGLTGEGSENNYLTYWDATGSDYFKANTTFTVLPYWITPDGIEVKGASTRTITIGTLTRRGISKNDGDVIDPVYGN